MMKQGERKSVSIQKILINLNWLTFIEHSNQGHQNTYSVQVQLIVILQKRWKLDWSKRRNKFTITEWEILILLSQWITATIQQQQKLLSRRTEQIWQIKLIKISFFLDEMTSKNWATLILCKYTWITYQNRQYVGLWC